MKDSRIKVEIRYIGTIELDCTSEFSSLRVTHMPKLKLLQVTHVLKLKLAPKLLESYQNPLKFRWDIYKLFTNPGREPIHLSVSVKICISCQNPVTNIHM